MKLSYVLTGFLATMCFGTGIFVFGAVLVFLVAAIIVLFAVLIYLVAAN